MNFKIYTIEFRNLSTVSSDCTKSAAIWIKCLSFTYNGIIKYFVIFFNNQYTGIISKKHMKHIEATLARYNYNTNCIWNGEISFLRYLGNTVPFVKYEDRGEVVFQKQLQLYTYRPRTYVWLYVLLYNIVCKHSH